MQMLVIPTRYQGDVWVNPEHIAQFRAIQDEGKPFTRIFFANGPFVDTDMTPARLAAETCSLTVNLT